MNKTLRQALGLALGLVTLAPQPASSQNNLPILPGQRVRVTVSPGRSAVHSAGGLFLGSGQKLVGDWEANSEGAIVLTDEQGMGSWHIPAESVERIEVSLGHERRMGRSLAEAVLGGAVGIGILAAMAWEPCESTGFMSCMFTPNSRSDSFAMGFAGGAILGVPVGLLGGLRKHEIWEDQPVQNIRTSIQPAPGGRIGLGLTIPTGNRYSP